LQQASRPQLSSCSLSGGIPARTAQVGEINIDNSLVVENLLSKEDLVSMDRGCVCCSLRNDIVGALRELQSRATSRAISYDAILLETTGLADPAPVAFTFFANSWISANYRLDSILCLVDAQHLRRVRSAACLPRCMHPSVPGLSRAGAGVLVGVRAFV
jgi:G3E family GTPase